MRYRLVYVRPDGFKLVIGEYESEDAAREAAMHLYRGIHIETDGLAALDMIELGTELIKAGAERCK